MPRNPHPRLRLHSSRNRLPGWLLAAFCATISLAPVRGAGFGAAAFGAAADAAITSAPDSIPPLPAPAAPDSSLANEARANLTAFLALSEAQRAERVKQSRDWLDRWREFATNARRTQAVHEAEIVGAKVPDNAALLQKWLGGGAYEAADWLSKATALDPGNAEAWLDLADLDADMGARGAARAALAAVEQALLELPPPDREKGKEVRLDIVRAQAWLDRDEGRWAEGLSRIERGLRLAPEDLELRLVKGLLLADSGRFQEACTIARELPGIEYRVFDQNLMGLSTAQSDYGSRWIQAVAYLAIGETRLADYALGPVHPERRHLPFMRHYWNDVGLVCELNDRPADAAVYYAIALLATSYHDYYPWQGFSARPKILGQPDARLPVYVFPNQCYLAGSLFAYGAQLAAEVAGIGDAALARARGAAADSALSLCVRRNIRHSLALALRGELRAVLHEDDLAGTDLERARAELARQGLRNARTSTLLGLLRLSEKEYPQALELLREAVAADSASSSAWRTLGVALAEMERPGEARLAMNRAIALAPRAASGWYNRGLLSLTGRQWDQAVADLRTAAALAPADPEIVRALWRAERQLPDTIVTRTVLTRADTTLIPVPPPSERLDLRTATAVPGSEALPHDRIGRLLAAASPADTAAAREVRQLEQAFRRVASPQNRGQLAAGYMRLGAPERALELLLPAWGRDLSALEVRIVLEADRARGNDARALSVAASVDPRHPDPPDRDLWALVSNMCASAGRVPEALRAADAALALDPRNSGLMMYRELLRAKRPSKGAP